MSGEEAVARTWPDSFPAACPPDDAVVAEGSFTDCRRSDPDQAGLSQPPRALGARRTQEAKLVHDCQAAGLSVYADLDDIKHQRKSVGPMRSKHIALGRVDGSGVMKPTPPAHSKNSHHTLWRYADDECWDNFQVVA